MLRVDDPSVVGLGILRLDSVEVSEKCRGRPYIYEAEGKLKEVCVDAPFQGVTILGFREFEDYSSLGNAPHLCDHAKWILDVLDDMAAQGVGEGASFEW